MKKKPFCKEEADIMFKSDYQKEFETNMQKVHNAKMNKAKFIKKYSDIEGLTTKELESDVDLLLSAERWISVEDELPKDSWYVLVYMKKNKIIKRAYYGYTSLQVLQGNQRKIKLRKTHKWWYDCGLHRVYAITHWQPLPKPPITKRTTKKRGGCNKTC